MACDAKPRAAGTAVAGVTRERTTSRSANASRSSTGVAPAAVTASRTAVPRASSSSTRSCTFRSTPEAASAPPMIRPASPKPMSPQRRVIGATSSVDDGLGERVQHPRPVQRALGDLRELLLLVPQPGLAAGHHLRRPLVRDHDDAVAVPDDDVPVADHDAADLDRSVDLAGAVLVRAEVVDAEREDRHRPGRQAFGVPHGAVDHECGQPAGHGVAAHDLAEDRPLEEAAAVDDEHVAGLGQVQRPVDDEVVPGPGADGQGRAGHPWPPAAGHPVDAAHSPDALHAVGQDAGRQVPAVLEQDRVRPGAGGVQPAGAHVAPSSSSIGWITVRSVPAGRHPRSACATAARPRAARGTSGPCGG